MTFARPSVPGSTTFRIYLDQPTRRVQSEGILLGDLHFHFTRNSYWYRECQHNDLDIRDPPALSAGRQAKSLTDHRLYHTQPAGS